MVVVVVLFICAFTVVACFISSINGTRNSNSNNSSSSSGSNSNSQEKEKFAVNECTTSGSCTSSLSRRVLYYILRSSVTVHVIYHELNYATVSQAKYNWCTLLFGPVVLVVHWSVVSGSQFNSIPCTTSTAAVFLFLCTFTLSLSLSLSLPVERYSRFLFLRFIDCRP